MKVLIVEDSEPMLRMIHRTVAAWATEIHCCDDGAAAVGLYFEQLPDWVLMDVDLKQVNGIAATGQIVRRDPRAKILMVTNYDDEEIRQAAARAGARGYLLKENLHNLLRAPEAV